MHAGIEEHSKPNQKLKQGLEKLGVHCGEIPRNCSTAHTCGHCCFGCPSGDKQDMTGTYLSDAAAKGTCIFTGEPCICPFPVCRVAMHRLWHHT